MGLWEDPIDAMSRIAFSMKVDKLSRELDVSRWPDDVNAGIKAFKFLKPIADLYEE